MDRSLDWAARHFGVNRTSILSRSRKQPAAAARQACMWLARQSLGLTVADLGYMFGRHYSSVIFACQAIDGYRDVYPEFRAALDSALVMVIRSDRARPLAGPPP
jgi:chromosomal replication initiation ATPase DnaA